MNTLRALLQRNSKLAQSKNEVRQRSARRRCRGLPVPQGNDPLPPECVVARTRVPPFSQRVLSRSSLVHRQTGRPKLAARVHAAALRYLPRLPRLRAASVASRGEPEHGHKGARQVVEEAEKSLFRREVVVFVKNDSNADASCPLPTTLPSQDGGWTPLHFAARRGDVGVLRVLLDNGANPEQYTTARSMNSRLLLHQSKHACCSCWGTFAPRLGVTAAAGCNEQYSLSPRPSASLSHATDANPTRPSGFRRRPHRRRRSGRDGWTKGGPPCTSPRSTATATPCGFCCTSEQRTSRNRRGRSVVRRFAGPLFCQSVCTPACPMRRNPSSPSRPASSPLLPRCLCSLRSCVNAHRPPPPQDAWTALHLAAHRPHGQEDGLNAVRALIDEGADIEARTVVRSRGGQGRTRAGKDRTERPWGHGRSRLPRQRRRHGASLWACQQWR